MKTSSGWAWRLAAIVLGAAVVLIGCASRRSASCDHPSTEAIGAPQPVEVLTDSLDPVRAAFNAHADGPRVVLLVSPVCGECVYGAKGVRKSIIDRFASSGVRAVVVWTPMLRGDDEAAAQRSSGIFAGAGAEQFFDPGNLAGWAYQRTHFSGAWDQVDAALPLDHWMRERKRDRKEPGPQWDLYMLYKAGARWESTPPRPEAFIRHAGRDQEGQSWFWRDTFGVPPTRGDLFQAMEAMGAAVLGDNAPGLPASGIPMKIELLGFPGCPNTPAMRDHLRAALREVGGGRAFADIDQEALPPGDPRRGWPAPTILVNGADLFGMLPAPHGAPAMGCRLYEDGGTPSPERIAERLSAMRDR